MAAVTYKATKMIGGGGRLTNNMTMGGSRLEFIIKSKSEKQKPLYVYISKMLDN